MKFSDLTLGQKADLKKIFTKENVLTFAELSGDHNLIHISEEFAATTIFKKPIVHGMLVASLISRTIAEKLPGVGSIYMNQVMNFKLPVYYGDEITCVVEIIELKPEKNIVSLSTNCLNQNGKVVIEGSAIIKKID